MSRPAELVLAVAAGSAVGGVARLLLTAAIQLRTGPAFPYGTLAVNVIGCFALGLVTQLLLDARDVSPGTAALLTTGLCGGFTTFSTFSLETIRLVEQGELMRAGGYAGGSVVLGIGALWLGMAAGRMLRG